MFFKVASFPSNITSSNNTLSLGDLSSIASRTYTFSKACDDYFSSNFEDFENKGSSPFSSRPRASTTPSRDPSSIKRSYSSPNFGLRSILRSQSAPRTRKKSVQFSENLEDILTFRKNETPSKCNSRSTSSSSVCSLGAPPSYRFSFTPVNFSVDKNISPTYSHPLLLSSVEFDPYLSIFTGSVDVINISFQKHIVVRCSFSPYSHPKIPSFSYDSDPDTAFLSESLIVAQKKTVTTNTTPTFSPRSYSSLRLSQPREMVFSNKSKLIPLPDSSSCHPSISLKPQQNNNFPELFSLIKKPSSTLNYTSAKSQIPIPSSKSDPFPPPFYAAVSKVDHQSPIDQFSWYSSSPQFSFLSSLQWRQRHPNNNIKEFKQKKIEKLKIFSYNIRGFKGSKLELEYILSKRRPNIIGIQESLLTRDTNRCNINGYTCIESKSDVARGGNGLILGVKNGFGIKIYEYKSTPYWLIGKLTATTTTNTIFTMYVVNVHIPSASIRKRKALESLEKALQKLKNNKNDVKIIVMGDFNMDKKQVLNWIRKLGIGLQLNNVTNSKGSRRVGTEMGRMIDHILHNDALNPPNYCIIAHAMDL
ncbi:hypothetical protein BB560_004385, partial [Smittium megazygosporum]